MINSRALLLGAACSAILIPVHVQAQTSPGFEDEIIVTGSPLNQTPDEAITGLSIISGDNLARRIAPTLGETLKSEPGVSSTFFGPGASRPIIRGQGAGRVRILTNGIGSIDASAASPDHAVAAEPAQAERIEVVRGAALLRFGSSGSGGVVNVIDGRMPTTLTDDGRDGAIRLGVSSVDGGREGAAALNQQLGDNVVLHLGVTARGAGDYRANGESIENSQSQSNSVTLGGSYIGNALTLSGAYHEFETDYGIPGGHGHEEEEGHDEDEDHDEEAEEEEEENVTISLKQKRFDFNAGLEMDGYFDRINVFAGIADYQHIEFEGPGEVGTIFNNEGYEMRAEAVRNRPDGRGQAYGLQLTHRDFEAIGDEAFVPPTSTDSVGIYTFQEKEIGEFHLEGAARYERTEIEDNSTRNTRSFDGFSVSLGADRHIGDAVRIGGTVFRTERAPSSEELFSNGPHLATSQFERGDDALGIETATGVEAALRHREDGHFVTLNLFYTDYSDYIFERETGAMEDGLPVFQYGAEDASFSGFELQGGRDLFSIGGLDISGDALLEYVRAETDSGNLPRIPPLSILAGLDFDHGARSYRVEAEYVAEAENLAALETPTKAYTLVNTFADWHFDAAQNVTISASVMNIFDEDARQHTSFLKDDVPLPGRNLRLSIRAAF
ncbi:TonB-dependent receptor [Robiginitomaculum antarcticum]|uniref:TonB-dependent receptor n=1 Tax=Robiginitomaculum antarcticum TaxID=437507 RepID=UPI0003654C18|nr:TonB-dependent receptor [Robiginitomaculum antarcticum]